MKAAVLCLLLACATSVSAASVSVTLKDVPNIDCPGVGSGAAGSYSPRELDASVTNVMNLVSPPLHALHFTSVLERLCVCGHWAWMRPRMDSAWTSQPDPVIAPPPSRANAPHPCGPPDAPQVTEEFFSAYNNTALAPCDDFVIGYIDGCSQVVAGTNWQLLFEVTCPDQPGAKVNLKAYVFEPLPSSKQPIEITKVSRAAARRPGLPTPGPLLPLITRASVCPRSSVCSLEISPSELLSSSLFHAATMMVSSSPQSRL
jgi:hypothetical protein